MDVLLIRAFALLGLAILVALLARRLRLPNTAGLALAGAALAAFRVDAGLALTHDLIFDVVLPPLLFEAALNLHWSELEARSRARHCAVDCWRCAQRVRRGGARCTPWLGWPIASGAGFGALIAATDPIAVIALCGIPHNRAVAALVEAESLVNDGAAAVLFALDPRLGRARSMAAGGPFGGSKSVYRYRRRRAC